MRSKKPAPTVNFGPARTYWHLPPYWPKVIPPADFCLDDVSARKPFKGSEEYVNTIFTFRPPSVPQYASLNSKLKALKSRTAESAVKTLFLEGLPAALAKHTRVVRVDSIINKSAFRIYDAMRISSEKRLGKSRTREAWLWHGTSEENIAKICTNGFDRSFGKVAMYGHGVYFARDSGYSASTRYSKPNKAGLQRMMLCRVLVCESCIGKQKFTFPQSKKFPRENENYESMVDDMKAPTIFVSTRDFQAIPEFLVTFHMKGSSSPHSSPFSTSGGVITADSAKLKIGVEVPIQDVSG